jgi:uncharacterized membrane protein
VTAGLALAWLLPGLSQGAYGQCRYEVHVISLEGNCHVYATALNDSGVVVGSYGCGAGFNQPFRWTEEGGIELVEPPAGSSETFLNDVNDAGQIVGSATIGQLRAFLLDHGEYTMLPSDLPYGSSQALAINDSGMVVGHRHIDVDGDFRTNAFVWTREGGFVDLGLMGETETVARDVNTVGPSRRKTRFRYSK